MQEKQEKITLLGRNTFKRINKLESTIKLLELENSSYIETNKTLSNILQSLVYYSEIQSNNFNHLLMYLAKEKGINTEIQENLTQWLLENKLSGVDAFNSALKKLKEDNTLDPVVKSIIEETLKCFK